MYRFRFFLRLFLSNGCYYELAVGHFIRAVIMISRIVNLSNDFSINAPFWTDRDREENDFSYFNAGYVTSVDNIIPNVKWLVWTRANENDIIRLFINPGQKPRIRTVKLYKKIYQNFFFLSLIR